MARAKERSRSKPLSDPSTGGKPPRRPRKREREILDRAIEMFHESGYAETSVEDVANAVGILKGSLYYYIDSKEDLLARILEDVHRGVLEIIEEIDSQPELTALERLSLYVREQVIFNATRIKEITVYHHEFGRLTGKRLEQIKRHRRASERWLIGVIEEAQEQGDIDSDLDPKLAAKCIFAPIVWMYTWYRPGRSVPPSTLADFFAEFVLHGLAGARANRASDGGRQAPPA